MDEDFYLDDGQRAARRLQLRQLAAREHVPRSGRSVHLGIENAPSLGPDRLGFPSFSFTAGTNRPTNIVDQAATWTARCGRTRSR